MTDFDFSRAVDLHQKGLTLRQIGRLLGANPQDVARVLDVAGVRPIARQPRYGSTFVNGRGWV